MMVMLESYTGSMSFGLARHVDWSSHGSVEWALRVLTSRSL